MLLRVVEFCRERGHDGDALCRSVSLDPSFLAEPDARVQYATAVRLGERALRITRDDNFGLHLAQDVRDTRKLDVGVLLLMASPTIRVALGRMVARQRYWGDGERATIERVRRGMAIRYILPGVEGAYARHADECAMAEIALGVPFLAGQALPPPRVVRFRHPSPRSTAEHRVLFACPIEFDADHTEIVFDDAVLDARMLHANEIFCEVFKHEVDRVLARLPPVTSASAGVRSTVRAALSGGQCTLVDTARVLGVSTRTLQRRLRAEGTSFGELLDGLRREMALAYLERGVSTPEVAMLLGYSEPTAFHHAFRRWTGSSPTRHGGSRAPED